MTSAQPPDSPRVARGRRAQSQGLEAEARVAAALRAEGWEVRGSRVRTPAGEVDLVVERDGLLVVAEVKSRPRLADAALALSPRQRARLLGAAEWLLGEHPAWGRAGVRFDVLLVDATGAMRRIVDAFRLE